jgi:hypothetical protein
MDKIIISAFLLMGVFQINTHAQQKIERERSLKSEDVPQEAMQFIVAVDMDTQWKWYFEENLVGNSVEAKARADGKRYSVEFDTSGNIQDVEVETSWKALDEQLRGSISQALDSMFRRHSIDKIQVQYSAEAPVLLAILNNRADPANSRIQYELVVKGKTTGRPKLYELTFSENGKLLETSEIIFRNTDHLEY